MHVINVAANVNTVAKIYGLASQLNGVIWTCGLYGAYMCHFLNIERGTLRLNSDKPVKSSFGWIKSLCGLAVTYRGRITLVNWYFGHVWLLAPLYITTHTFHYVHAKKNNCSLSGWKVYVKCLKKWVSSMDGRLTSLEFFLAGLYFSISWRAYVYSWD